MSEVTILSQLKTVLGITDNASDNTLNTYLDLAEREILSWTFGNTIDEVPSEYYSIKLMSVVVGMNTRGAEGEINEGVDGVSHSFKYADMLEYIHSNCPVWVAV